MEHALAHRNIDIQSSLFELAADAAVLLLKKSNSLSLDLRSNFLDRWGLFLGILTLLNRGALFILWLVSPTPRVYAQRWVGEVWKDWTRERKDNPHDPLFYAGKPHMFVIMCHPPTTGVARCLQLYASPGASSFLDGSPSIVHV